jgi:hypothetical protein
LLPAGGVSSRRPARSNHASCCATVSPPNARRPAGAAENVIDRVVSSPMGTALPVSCRAAGSNGRAIRV